jgi:hypothetical protein
MLCIACMHACMPSHLLQVTRTKHLFMISQTRTWSTNSNLSPLLPSLPHTLIPLSPSLSLSLSVSVSLSDPQIPSKAHAKTTTLQSPTCAPPWAAAGKTFRPHASPFANRCLRNARLQERSSTVCVIRGPLGHAEGCVWMRGKWHWTRQWSCLKVAIQNAWMTTTRLLCWWACMYVDVCMCVCVFSCLSCMRMYELFVYLTCVYEWACMCICECVLVPYVREAVVTCIACCRFACTKSFREKFARRPIYLPLCQHSLSMLVCMYRGA